jgi:glycosyltransferase involved in cell wall biosynthesis
MTRQLTLSANATPNEGGQGLNLSQMIEGCRDAFDVAVYSRATCNGTQSHPVSESKVSRTIDSVRPLRRLRGWRTYFSDTHFDEYVARKLNGADIFQGVTGQCFASLKAAKKNGSATLLDSITTHIDDFGSQQDRECAKFQVRPPLHARHRERMRREYERADLIRVMSHVARRTFIDHGVAEDKIVVLPPVIDPDKFSQAQFDQPKFRISFVGLVEPWKGFHYLIDAFNALNDPDSELVLWGGTGTRNVSRYMAKEIAQNPSIKLMPVEVRRHGYAEVYAKSSVLVHPSLADGFGFVVAEAMASGIPIIVTSNTGAADIVVDGVNGYIVPAADSDAIRDRLAHLAANPALLREMGHAARIAAASLTFERFRERYQTCLNTLAA